MRIRVWLNKISPILSVIVLGLFFPIISHAQLDYAVEVNEIHLNGDVYTSVVVKVAPAARSAESYKTIPDRLKFIQEKQLAMSQSRHFIWLSNEFVAENYMDHKRVDADGNLNAYATGTSQKFPDPLDLDKMLRELGMTSVKTKVDDILNRESVTVLLFRGKSFLGKDLVASIKAVKSDPVRIFKDLVDTIPSETYLQVLSHLTPENQSTEFFEVENLSISKKLGDKYNFLPFLKNEIDRSDIFESRVRNVVETMIYINSLNGPAPLYRAMGFEDCAFHPLAKISFMDIKGADFKPRLSQFFRAKTLMEFIDLPWVQKMSIGDYTHSNLYFKLLQRKPEFIPTEVIKLPFDCSFNYSLQVPQSLTSE